MIDQDIEEYLDGVWEHLALWKKKDILEEAGFNLAISAKQEEYLDEMRSEGIKSEDFEV